MQDKRLNAYNLGLLRDDYPKDIAYGFPEANATQAMPKKLISFNNVLSDKIQDSEVFVHFFIDDYQFERVWKSPQRYLDIFKRYAGIIAPDFSLYSTMPRAMQIWNVYRNRWLSAYYAENGVQVIPAVNWSDSESYEYSFASLPHNSTLVLSTVGGMKCRVSKWHFVNGFHEMVSRLSPENIVIYGDFPDEWKARFSDVHIVKIDSLTKTLRRRIINWQG